MEIIYKANDGTIFYDEYDCIEYETIKEVKDINITCWNNNKKRIKLGEPDLYYFSVETQEDLIKFLEWQKGIYSYDLSKVDINNWAGVWYYDAEAEWSNANLIITTCQKMLNELE